MCRISEESVKRMRHGPPTEEDIKRQSESHIMRMLPGTFLPSTSDIDYLNSITESIPKEEKNKEE